MKYIFLFFYSSGFFWDIKMCGSRNSISRSNLLISHAWNALIWILIGFLCSFKMSNVSNFLCLLMIISCQPFPRLTSEARWGAKHKCFGCLSGRATCHKCADRATEIPKIRIIKDPRDSKIFDKYHACCQRMRPSLTHNQGELQRITFPGRQQFQVQVTTGSRSDYI